MKLRLVLFFILAAALVGLNSCSRQIRYPIERVPPISKQLPEMKPIPYTPPPAPIAAEEKATKGLIVIDPGHGGKDFGTHSLKDPRYQEKFLTLSTANLVRTYLRQMGYQTVMTRTEDKFIELNQRAKFANDLNPLLFISIHYNHADSAEASGIEVYYYNAKEDASRTTQSKLLANAVLNKVIGTTQAKSRGVKHGNFAVIRQTEMPAILIEGGFLSNPEERTRIKDAAYLKQLAWGIAQGVQDYLGK